jgi:tRNA dimethylallyltransferase
MTAKRIIILGVTASGKARLAFELARRLDAEIISVDSMKIYRRMDIGTAKPSLEMQQERQYHMIDLLEPSESYNVGLFYEQAFSTLHQIESRGKRVIAVGGTALYIKALMYGLFDGPGSDEGLRQRLKHRADTEGSAVLHRELLHIDPVAAERINPNDTRRIVRAHEVYQISGKPISSFQTQFDATKPCHTWTILGLRRAKELESQRINARVRKMTQAGLVAEVESLLQEDKPLSQQAQAAIGYAEIIEHLQGKKPLDETIEHIKINTRRLAKGQRTWYKTFTGINWLDIGENASFDALLHDALPLCE